MAMPTSSDLEAKDGSLGSDGAHAGNGSEVDAAKAAPVCNAVPWQKSHDRQLLDTASLANSEGLSSTDAGFSKTSEAVSREEQRASDPVCPGQDPSSSTAVQKTEADAMAAPTRSKRAAAARSEAQSRQMTLALNGALALDKMAAKADASAAAANAGQAASNSAGGTSVEGTGDDVPKRRKRGRPRKDEAAAIARQKERINLVDEEEEELAEEDRRRLAEERKGKRKEKEEREMSLQVKGNGVSEGKVHSIFARKPPPTMTAKEEAKEKGASSKPESFFVAGNGSRSAAPLSSHIKRKAQLDARWPTREELHVEPPTSVLDVRPSWPRQYVWPKKASQDRQGDCNIYLQLEEEKAPWKHHTVASDEAPTHRSRLPIRASRLQAGDFDKLFAESRSYLSKGLARRLSNGCSPTQKKSANEAWTDRWRPLRSDESLGNEVEATYMRDWIRQLQLVPSTSVKSRAATEQIQDDSPSLSSTPPASFDKDTSKKRVMMQVQKRAEKKRRKKKKIRKGDLDGFLVDDEDGEGSIDEEDEEESAWFDQFRRTDDADANAACETENVVESDDMLFANSTRLANVLVLAGPTGCGKTASVYACAAELDHEVFELYPGMGKRSGKELSTAVGDLGRNHMVSSGGTGGGATWKLLDRREANTKLPTSNGHSGKPRQSIILIEEVDLLFDDDKGFWPAVIELVAESRRPVVLTCNDLSAVPLNDLPIQRVLTFRPPAADLAAPYLQLICAHEGYFVERADIETVYEATQGDPDVRMAVSQLTLTSSGRDGGPMKADAQLNAIDKCLGEASLTAHDLRQAVNQLQFECQRASKEEVPNATSSIKENARSQAQRMTPRQLENRSFFDAFIEAPYDRASELLEPDRYWPFAVHDQLQLPNEMVALPKASPDPKWTALPSFSREDEYRTCLLPSRDSGLEMQLLQERLATSRKIERVLGCRYLCFNPSWSAFLGSDYSITDYISALCRMVAIDDEAHTQHLAEVARAQQEALARRQLLLEEAGIHVSDGNQRQQQQLDEEALRSASFSLAKIGIRSTRGSTQMLLSGSSEGPGEFVRLLDVDTTTLESIRALGSFSM